MAGGGVGISASSSNSFPLPSKGALGFLWTGRFCFLGASDDSGISSGGVTFAFFAGVSLTSSVALVFLVGLFGFFGTAALGSSLVSVSATGTGVFLTTLAFLGFSWTAALGSSVVSFSPWTDSVTGD